MHEPYLSKYAQLLTAYCLGIQPGDRLLIQAPPIAEPLVKEVYRLALRAGAVVEIDWMFSWRNPVFFQEAQGKQLQHLGPQLVEAFENYETYLHIRAPNNLRDSDGATPEQMKIRNETWGPLNQTYFSRTGDRRLRRCLCQFPTDAAAQEAGMSLENYKQFVIEACKLDLEHPASGWLTLRQSQQAVVDHLNACTRVRYLSQDTDISFATNGRIWINSDGQTNMPSGEVYTSPVEDSVNGKIFFSFPGLHAGNTVEGVHLEVKDGYIERWSAARGEDYLDRVFQIPGARRFGEAAIGTNYQINKITRNILYDEKIGGSVHMAIGQSYLQCGGKNESAIHWDMITDMTQGGQIYADEQLIYENGHFLIGNKSHTPT